MFGIMIVFSMCLAFLTHFFLVRICGLFKRPFSRHNGAIAGFLFGFMPLAAMFYLWAVNLKIKELPAILSSGLYLFLIYGLFSYVYFHFFNMSETARRVRILAEIQKARVFKRDRVHEEYSARDMISNRLKRLVAGIFILPANIIFYLRRVLYPRR